MLVRINDTAAFLKASYVPKYHIRRFSGRFVPMQYVNDLHRLSILIMSVKKNGSDRPFFSPVRLTRELSE